MPIAEFDPTALATWIVGGVTVVTMVVLAALGSYYGSIRSVGAIAVVIEKNHGETMAAIGILKTSQADLHGWVEDISHGRSPHIATINERLDNHDEEIKDHKQRLSALEIDHAKQMGRGGCKP